MDRRTSSNGLFIIFWQYTLFEIIMIILIIIIIIITEAYCIIFLFSICNIFGVHWGAVRPLKRFDYYPAAHNRRRRSSDVSGGNFDSLCGETLHTQNFVMS